MGKAVTRKEAEQMLENALEIGARMLISGAEISRVEDSILRICTAYGSERTEVFSITYTIVATISSKNFGIITQSRRIHGLAFNLQELKYLNNLSRNVCVSLPDMDEVRSDLKRIHELPQYTNRQGMLIYALISSAFTPVFWRLCAGCGNLRGHRSFDQDRGDPSEKHEHEPFPGLLPLFLGSRGPGGHGGTYRNWMFL